MYLDASRSGSYIPFPLSVAGIRDGSRCIDAIFIHMGPHGIACNPRNPPDRDVSRRPYESLCTPEGRGRERETKKKKKQEKEKERVASMHISMDSTLIGWLAFICSRTAPQLQFVPHRIAESNWVIQDIVGKGERKSDGKRWEKTEGEKRGWGEMGKAGKNNHPFFLGSVSKEQALGCCWLITIIRPHLRKHRGRSRFVPSES